MYFWSAANLDHMIRKRHPHTFFRRSLPGSAEGTGYLLAPSAIGPNLHVVLCQSASALYGGGLRAGNYSTSYAYDANSNLTSITRMAIEGLQGGGVFIPGGIGYILSGNQVTVRLQGSSGFNAMAMTANAPAADLLHVYYDSCGRMVRDDDLRR